LLPYPSIGHALGQLKTRKSAKQVGKSGTWRYSAAAREGRTDDRK